MKAVVHFANCLGAAALILLFGLSNVAKAADDNPLRPADTSSPRATLQGFVETLDELYLRVTDVMKGYAESGRLYLTPEERRRQYANLSGAVKVVRYLDTSEISPVLRDAVAAEHALQFKEILDRIDLPSINDIPDRDVVARSSIKRWRGWTRTARSSTPIPPCCASSARRRLNR